LDKKSPFAAAPGGVSVNIRLTPKASRDRIGPVAMEADGGRVLKVQVTAVPEDGKANKALIRLLAKAWRLPKTALSVKKGVKDRQKTIHIEGATEDLLQRLRDVS
jgi:uncharacterized protein (TIGR00251 family)